ncbi:MAG: RNA polymerase sigma factor [Actinomycetota bacterium]|nr:RNA polymerase sigma factor [Actinomycetota bacterium]
MRLMQVRTGPLNVEEPRTLPANGFEAFFRAEHVRLYRALYLLTGSSHDADEILQQAFCKVWERWDRIRVMEDPRGYLYRTAMNEFRSAYRRAKRTARLLLRLPLPQDDAIVRSEARMEVLHALASVSPRQRTALVLTEVLGYSSAEAAVWMNVEPGAVRTLAARGRVALNRQRRRGHA